MRQTNDVRNLIYESDVVFSAVRFHYKNIFTRTHAKTFHTFIRKICGVMMMRRRTYSSHAHKNILRCSVIFLDRFNTYQVLRQPMHSCQFQCLVSFDLRMVAMNNNDQLDYL